MWPEAFIFWSHWVSLQSLSSSMMCVLLHCSISWSFSQRAVCWSSVRRSIHCLHPLLQPEFKSLTHYCRIFQFCLIVLFCPFVCLQQMSIQPKTNKSLNDSRLWKHFNECCDDILLWCSWITTLGGTRKLFLWIQALDFIYSALFLHHFCLFCTMS